MSEQPRPWMEKLIDQVEAFVELDSPGSLDIRYNDVEYQLLIAPDVLELVGGKHDGDEVYPFFTVNLSVLFESFDETPEVMWHTMHDELWVDGRIGGEDAFIIFKRHPFDDVGPASHVFEGNMLREKRDEEE